MNLLTERTADLVVGQLRKELFLRLPLRNRPRRGDLKYSKSTFTVDNTLSSVYISIAKTNMVFAPDYFVPVYFTSKKT